MNVWSIKSNFRAAQEASSVTEDQRKKNIMGTPRREAESVERKSV